MGKQWKQCQTLFLGGSKITSDGDCSHEIKRRLLLGRKVMANLDSILKAETLLCQQRSSKAMGFPVVMWVLHCEEGWALKNWCFWTVVLEKTLESPWDCKEIQPVHPKVRGVYWKDWCWSWNSNTLATWCEELTHWKRPWCWEGLGGRRRRGQQSIRWHHWLDGHEFE